jgi:endogenous inhibitor of DNA gyrase (YacG/DUF329 family)
MEKAVFRIKYGKFGDGISVPCPKCSKSFRHIIRDLKETVQCPDCDISIMVLVDNNLSETVC